MLQPELRENHQIVLKDFTLYKYLSSTTIFLWGEEGGGIIKGRGVGVSGTFGVYTCT